MSRLTMPDERAVPDSAEFVLATGEQLQPDRFPALGNLSAGFLYNLLAHPQTPMRPEFVFLPLARLKGRARERVWVTMSKWNVAWEAAQLRGNVMGMTDVPPAIAEVAERGTANLYLLPETEHRYHEYALLYHLLPKSVLERHQLPLLKQGDWPELAPWEPIGDFLPSDFGERLSGAFAAHIWNRIDSGSSLPAFDAGEPLRLLAHNLDFWLPHAVAVAEDLLREFGRVAPDDEGQAQLIDELREGVPPGVLVDRPRRGGQLWEGEDLAKEIADEVVERADSGGRLRAIIEAVRSNRVRDDFSDRWSFAREDFERKLYRKRAKIKVAFVELTDTIPVQGRYSEVEDNIVYEDFLALLDARERRVVVLLRDGFTRVGEIASKLGYRNHSPVSKTLMRIRAKAETFFDNV